MRMTCWGVHAGCRVKATQGAKNPEMFWIHLNPWFGLVRVPMWETHGLRMFENYQVGISRSISGLKTWPPLQRHQGCSLANSRLAHPCNQSAATNKRLVISHFRIFPPSVSLHTLLKWSDLTTALFFIFANWLCGLCTVWSRSCCTLEGMNSSHLRTHCEYIEIEWNWILKLNYKSRSTARRRFAKSTDLSFQNTPFQCIAICSPFPPVSVVYYTSMHFEGMRHVERKFGKPINVINPVLFSQVSIKMQWFAIANAWYLHDIARPGSCKSGRRDLLQLYTTCI